MVGIVVAFPWTRLDATWEFPARRPLGAHYRRERFRSNSQLGRQLGGMRPGTSITPFDVPPQNPALPLDQTSTSWRSG